MVKQTAMCLREILLIFALITVKCLANPHQSNETKRFPDDFLFGVASSAYQIEGAWNVDGKGPSVWDAFTHTHPERIKDGQNCDVGPNSYEFYLDDIAAVKNLKMDFYRFSISWPRILPNGDVSNVNEKGIEYYNKIIDKLLELKIQPMVTMYHFDLPQNFKQLGGFSNSIIVNYFKAYANLLFERFGDRVKYWITINEPAMFCKVSDGSLGQTDFHGIADYLCGHNVLKMHAVVYRLYKKRFYDRFKGRIGIALESYFYYSDANDTNLIDYAMQFSLGWFGHPIFGKGNYPTVMISQIDNNSKQEGRPWSRLPTFSKQWIDTIRFSADFLGLNYYTSRFVEKSDKPVGENPSFERDRNIKEIIKPEWKPSVWDRLYSVPQGLGDLLRWIKKEYNNPMVIITENGWVDSGELQDDDRVEYYQKHLQQVQNAILNDGCNVKGYTAWSIIDNFEWRNGFTLKFGLYSVNLTSSRKERTAKKSTYFMKEVTTTRGIPNL